MSHFHSMPFPCSCWPPFPLIPSTPSWKNNQVAWTHTNNQSCGLNFWRPTVAGRWWLTFSEHHSFCFDLKSVLSSLFHESRKEGSFWRQEARGGMGRPDLSERTQLDFYRNVYKKDSRVLMNQVPVTRTRITSLFSNTCWVSTAR